MTEEQKKSMQHYLKNMKNREPKYIVSLYGEEDWLNSYFSITVAEIETNRIVESIVKLYDWTNFKQEINSYLSDVFPESIVVFNNNNLQLTRYLIDNYKEKLLTKDTMVYTRVYGYMPNKRMYEDMLLTENQEKMFRDTWGVCNYFLLKAKGL